jgi:hypothetical protein
MQGRQAAKRTNNPAGYYKLKIATGIIFEIVPPKKEVEETRFLCRSRSVKQGCR